MAAADVITLDVAAAHLNMTSTGADAAELAVHISAASAMVEHHVGPVIIREFTDYERYGRRIVLDRGPVVSLVSVTPSYGGDVLDVAEFRVTPDTGVVRYATGGRLAGGPYDIAYTAGRAVTVDTVPPALTLACCVIVAHLWETQRAVTFGGQAGFGTDDFVASSSGSGFAVPYRARDLMAPYRSVVV
ncbi:hypothetical protein [Pseudonocardia parietis]|uniref:PhiE125 gp8 family phage protein n=1 Tax=Pseudonocardia parietis TaxID=570936 RepID=A0ABS4W1Z4_9PSEU|nr:hypothetical protein [Pseudonocardia parietis]MBP2370227.1 putative phiE125 gp8 family phage protein [Pseudonocardia parietis]